MNQSEPMFILVQNYNYFNTLKMWLFDPPVFFVLFVLTLATIASVKIYDVRPFKWALVLTVSFIFFKVLPMKTHPTPMDKEQITQISTQWANANNVAASAPLPPVAPVASPVVAPAVPVASGTPSAQLITN